MEVEVQVLILSARNDSIPLKMTSSYYCVDLLLMAPQHSLLIVVLLSLLGIHH